ncbi:MAG: BLUF domain-containing protein [Gallionella sp.]
MLVRLIYSSYSTTNLNSADIAQILQTSQKNNSAKRITGVLFYSDRYFLQCLEGERHAVNETYLRIAADPRHAKCVLIDYNAVPSRLFPKWAMEHASFFGGLQNELIVKYTEMGVFQPFHFTQQQATSFLAEVAAIAATLDDTVRRSQQLILSKD